MRTALATNRRGDRDAFSLLEVILALAILCGAAALLGELVASGSRSAARARDTTQAQLLAESILAELLAGSVPLEVVQEAPLDRAGEWYYSVDAVQTQHQGVLALSILVQQNEARISRPVNFALTRWIRDPNWRPPIATAPTQ